MIESPSDAAEAADSAGQIDAATPVSIVTLDRICLRYSEASSALNNISFALQPGSFTFVTGESGAGKTSLLSMIGLALEPTEGTLHVLGHDTASLGRQERAALRRRFGMVFQNFRLLPHLTVFENVILPLQLAGADIREMRAEVEELIGWVGLETRMHDHPPSLSGGQQQQVAIARAVITKPQILLADEPTGSIDEEMGQRLFRLIEAMHRDGTTVVIATHDRMLVERSGYREIRLSGGQLVPPGDDAVKG